MSATNTEYDLPWHEVPVLSDRWKDTDAKLRISEGRSTRHGVPPGMLDKQQHAPKYYGVAYLECGADHPVKLLERPSQCSMPRDGQRLPGGETLVRIKYEFPDGGSPIWHRTVMAALDAITLAPAEQWSGGVTLGSSLELVPQVFGPNQRPTGQRGAWLWARYGADSVNDAVFRILLA